MWATAKPGDFDWGVPVFFLGLKPGGACLGLLGQGQADHHIRRRKEFYPTVRLVCPVGVLLCSEGEHGPLPFSPSIFNSLAVARAVVPLLCW